MHALAWFTTALLIVLPFANAGNLLKDVVVYRHRITEKMEPIRTNPRVNDPGPVFFSGEQLLITWQWTGSGPPTSQFRIYLIRRGWLFNRKIRTYRMILRNDPDTAEPVQYAVVKLPNFAASGRYYLRFIEFDRRKILTFSKKSIRRSYDAFEAQFRVDNVVSRSLKEGVRSAVENVQREIDRLEEKLARLMEPVVREGLRAIKCVGNAIYQAGKCVAVGAGYFAGAIVGVAVVTAKGVAYVATETARGICYVGAAAVGGVVKAGEAARRGVMYAAEVGENTVRAAGSGIATGAKAVGSGVAAGAKATGKGLAAGAKATRKGVVTAAKVTGKTIETGACATVHGVQNAWHSVETVVDDFNKRLIQENAQKAAVRKRDEAYKFQPEQISAEQGKQKIFTCHANPIAPNYPTSPANHAVRNPKSENRRRAPNNRKYSFYPPIPAHLIN